MLTEKQERNLQILRDMPEIFIPSDFTYWCHNTMYKPEKDWAGPSDRRNWTEIPTDEITIKGEMSFVTKVQRIQSAVDFGSKPSTRYANTENSLPFQIRVIHPKRNCLKKMKDDGLITEDDFKKKIRQCDGLGDYRHPKLPSKTKIYIIGSTTKDEISGEKIDIVYGVPEEDIELLTKQVLKDYTTNCKEDANYSIEDNYVSEAYRPTVIAKNEDRSRLFDSATRQAGYKTEYENMVKHK